MEDRPFPSAPEIREPATEPKDPLSMEQVREIHARSKDNAELQASWEAEQARRAQTASPETAERTDGPPDAAADKSSEQDRPGVLQDPDEPQPVQAEAPTRNSEGTQPSEEQPSPDKLAATDRDAERVEELETELAETKGELAEEKSDRRKLISVVADQAEEIKRLRAQLEAKGKTPDQSAAGDDAVDSSPKTVVSQEKPLSEPDRPWYKKMPLPSEKAAGLFTGAAGLVESVGVATHGMSGTTESIVGAAIGFGVAGIGYARERRKEQAEKEKEKNG